MCTPNQGRALDSVTSGLLVDNQAVKPTEMIPTGTSLQTHKYNKSECTVTLLDATATRLIKQHVAKSPKRSQHKTPAPETSPGPMLQDQRKTMWVRGECGAPDP